MFMQSSPVLANNCSDSMFEFDRKPAQSPETL